MPYTDFDQTQMKTSERWLSVDEIAHHLGISKETVYRWLEKGKIPAYRIGKLWKFRITEVDDWVLRGGSSEKAFSSKATPRRNKKS